MFKKVKFKPGSWKNLETRKVLIQKDSDIGEFLSDNKAFKELNFLACLLVFYIDVASVWQNKMVSIFK